LLGPNWANTIAARAAVAPQNFMTSLTDGNRGDDDMNYISNRNWIQVILLILSKLQARHERKFQTPPFRQ
jgi:hypothetical protein